MTKDLELLGQTIRAAREGAGIATRGLAEAVGVTKNAILNLEHGLVAKPRVEALATIATTLKLNLADLYAMAGYELSKSLPSFGCYLRSRYDQLPDEAVAKLDRYFTQIASEYDIDPNGPALGEDERHDK